MAKKKKTALAAALQKWAKKAADNKTKNKSTTAKTSASKSTAKTTTAKTTTKATTTKTTNKVQQAQKAVQKSNANQEALKKAQEQAKKKAAAQATQKNMLSNTKGVQQRTGVVLSEKTLTQKKPEKKSKVEMAEKAKNKSQQRTALGTKVERKTETFKVKDKNGKTVEKIDYSYEGMTAEDYNRLATATQQGRLNELLKSDKKLAKKVTDLNVKDYVKGAGAMGALDQMTQGLSVSQNPVYDYSDEQKKIIEAQKQTGKYNVGRFVGAAAEFGLGGTGTLGSSLAKTGGKLALKNAAQQSGKALAKQTAKNVAKETGADVFVSSGLNILDAVKDSYKDGKLDRNTFWKSLGMNVAGDVLIGGTVSGIVHGLSAKQVANFNKINQKKARGEALSEAEKKFHDKQVKQIGDEVVARIRKLKEQDQKAINQVAKATDNVEVKASEPTVSKAEAVETPVVAKSATDEQPKAQEIKNADGDKMSPVEKAKGVDEEAEWKRMSEEAYTNPTKTYNTANEKIIGDNPSPDEIRSKSKEISIDEVAQAKQTAVKLHNQAKDDVAEIIEPYIRNGRYDKKFVQSQADAMEQAGKEQADGSLYQKFMDSDATTNEHLFMARATTLLEELFEKAPNSDEATEQMLKVMDKASDASSLAGRLLNATKMLYRSTPDGRVRLITKEVERLNKKFADRLNGKEVKLTDEQIQRIYNATDDTIEEVAEQINKEVWEEIPATWFEKFNEIRHTSMLFNAKTHARNLAGNTVFALGRLVSDAIEIAIHQFPAVQNRLKKMDSKTDMVWVTRKELADNKKVLDEIFDKNYKKSNSQNKYIETSRPKDVTAVKNKYLSKIIKTNYGLLEREDLLVFKPEYRKNFIRWCKANNVELKDIPNMTKEQMRQADHFAMQRAERATFRDDSAFAKKIVGLKETTATKKGKTVIGTAGYRAANVALESNLPFVKTPVNILRRSVDYSPLGLLRSGIELATAKNAKQFMDGVHHLATGLTGTGVFALGMWLANKDFITVKAGEESGDAYYDRDMGYQDYSLVVGGDNKYSVTIDWLSPMQVSLFMGATAWNNLNEKGFSLEEMFDGLTAIAGPMLDMSFMSSAKDTVEMFTEKVYRNGTGDDADWSGAMAQTLFGSVPQGYLNAFIPQVVSQTAQAFDSKQRDTRSTKEDPIAASWDSFAKKIANRIPVLRNKVLNPKIDRFGKDIETGNNVLMRFFNAYANPSNVKKINFTELDKEIIKIFNHLEDGTDEKKYYYYNFTGNPSYDLGDDKRMSYDELYKYGKENRIQQTILIKDMVKSNSYKNMTWAMRAGEVNDAHWIAQTYADKKTYGNKFAVDRIIKSGSDTDKRAAEAGRSMGVSDNAFLDFYLTKEKLISRAHDSGYNTKALAVALSGKDKMAMLYDINIDKVNVAKEYLKNGGSYKKYTNASCNIMSAINKAEATNSVANKAFAAAQYKIDEGTYTAMGISEQKANMGAGLQKLGYTFKQLQEMKLSAKYGFDANQNGSISKAELVAYIDSLGIDSNETKACLFEYLKSSNARNPYGSIPNYLGFSETSGSAGGGGKSASKATEKAKKSDLPAWEDYVKDYISNIEKTAGVNFKDWNSPMNKTYQNKINALIKKMEA